MGRKWANIKEKKAKLDANNSKVYAKFGIEIYVAAKQGDPDPHSNQKLKFVIDRAKTYNVPKHVIDRAIEKAKGGGDESFQELRYEGFGPNGSMIMVPARYTSAKPFSKCSKPVRPVTAQARKSKTHASNVVAKAAPKPAKPLKSTFPPASTTVNASA